MKMTVSWLKKWMNVELPLLELERSLLQLGFEVESTKKIERNLEHLVIGRVVACSPHSEASKLRVATVDIGASKSLTIVCGAPNCRSNIVVAVALPGAVVGEKTIMPTSIRHVLSEGMLCSGWELGFKNYFSKQDGILELEEGLLPGTPLASLIPEQDVLLDLEITPNRGDVLSAEGLASELASLFPEAQRLPVTPSFKITDGPFIGFKELASLIPAWQRLSVAPSSSTQNRPDMDVKVSVEDYDLVPYYCAGQLFGVDLNRPVPIYIWQALDAVEQKATSPVVDVLNYLLIDVGHPMHLFDSDKIEGRLVIRKGRPGETIELLNGEQLTIAEGAPLLVAADDRGLLAVSGILGGSRAKVTSTTKNLLLEVATFSPELIATASRYYNLATAASYRFERAVSPLGLRAAFGRAEELLIQWFGGEASLGALPRLAVWELKPIFLSFERVNRLLGSNFSMSEVIRSLNALNCYVQEGDSEGQLAVFVPPWRLYNLTIEEELIEAIARLQDFNSIPCTSIAQPLTLLRVEERETLASTFRNEMADALGFTQVITYAFSGDKEQLDFDPTGSPLPLLTPFSASMKFLRTSLIPGLISTVQENQAKLQYRLSIFELGHCFKKRTEKTTHDSPIAPAHESLHLAAALSHDGEHRYAWKELETMLSSEEAFFKIKGKLEALLARLCPHILDGLAFSPLEDSAKYPWMHPGQSALLSLNGEPVGVIGSLHPEYYAKFRLHGPLALFELNLSRFPREKTPLAAKKRAFSRYPVSRRDLSLVGASDLDVTSLLACARAELETMDIDFNIQLVDVYKKEQDPEKSVFTLGVWMQGRQSTLTEKSMSVILDQIFSSISQLFQIFVP